MTRDKRISELSKILGSNDVRKKLESRYCVTCDKYITGFCFVPCNKYTKSLDTLLINKGKAKIKQIKKVIGERYE